MINILTLKKGDTYDFRTVNNLYHSIKKNSTVPFRFWCYTDDEYGLLDDIIVEKMHYPDEFPAHWHKVEFHRGEFSGIEHGEDVIIMDIDMIILQNIDDILNFPITDKEFAVIERWWTIRSNWCPINGGLQKFKHGSTHHIWKKFIAMPEYWPGYFSSIGQAQAPYMGEQNFIHHSIEECGLTRKYFPLDWFAKYNTEQPELYELWENNVRPGKYFENGKFDPSIKIVHFSNARGKDNQMDLSKDPWLKDYFLV